MMSQGTLVDRFAKGTARGSASHMFIDKDVLYSYGSHFPLAIRKRWGSGIEYLINGDRYSNTTSSHQNLCISNLTPNVQVPFSALDAADLTEYGLPQKGLKVVARRPDEYYITCKHCGRDLRRTSTELDYIHVHDHTPLCEEVEGETVTNHVLGAVVLKYRRRFFLSSVDDQEGWRLRAYFLCRLPKPVSSVEEAFDALMPEEVRQAKASGIEVRRQGDIFAIATTTTTREIGAPGRRQYGLFDTAHVATEARVNGATFIRGTLRHRPQGARPQHGMLHLGRSWWIAIKNTALGSWNAVGSID